LPASVETNSPSANAASSSTAPPAGCTLMSQHLPARLRFQVRPPSVEMKKPWSVAA
jgi:hypothetical protein